MSGRAVLKTVCKGQALFALSCAESEFYGLTTAASESLVNEASSWILKSSWSLSIAAKSSRKCIG